jgi:hypothetical protein
MKTSLRHAAAPQWRSRPRVNDWPKRPPSGQHPRRRFLGLAAGAAALPAILRTARAQSNPSRPICTFSITYGVADRVVFDHRPVLL